jgi:hypothetical protein
MPESWRDRVGDYRVLAQAIDGTLTVLALRVGHRRDVYGLTPLTAPTAGDQESVSQADPPSVIFSTHR